MKPSRARPAGRASHRRDPARTIDSSESKEHDRAIFVGVPQSVRPPLCPRYHALQGELMVTENGEDERGARPTNNSTGLTALARQNPDGTPDYHGWPDRFGFLDSTQAGLNPVGGPADDNPFARRGQEPVRHVLAFLLRNPSPRQSPSRAPVAGGRRPRLRPQGLRIQPRQARCRALCQWRGRLRLLEVERARRPVTISSRQFQRARSTPSPFALAVCLQLLPGRPDPDPRPRPGLCRGGEQAFVSAIRGSNQPHHRHVRP